MLRPNGADAASEDPLGAVTQLGFPRLTSQETFQTAATCLRAAISPEADEQLILNCRLNNIKWGYFGNFRAGAQVWLSGHPCGSTYWRAATVQAELEIGKHEAQPRGIPPSLAKLYIKILVGRLTRISPTIRGFVSLILLFRISFQHLGLIDKFCSHLDRGVRSQGISCL